VEQWLTVREVARVLKVSRATVYRLVAEGRLRHARVSNAVRIAGAELERLVRRR
jgi:excisionase family DNA binding protein